MLKIHDFKNQGQEISIPIFVTHLLTQDSQTVGLQTYHGRYASSPALEPIMVHEHTSVESRIGTEQ